MTNTSQICRSVLLIVAVGLCSACYEEEVWLEDNITPLGEYYPTIYMNDLEDEYASGAAVEVVLEFASQGTLEEIRLYEQVGEEAEENLVGTSPYQPAFSEKKAQDTLALTYTVPALSDTVEITLRAEAVNANGLTASSGNSFEAVP